MLDVKDMCTVLEYLFSLLCEQVDVHACVCQGVFELSHCMHIFQVVFLILKMHAFSLLY